MARIQLQVIGFPLKLYRRLREHKPDWESTLPQCTDVRYVPSRHKYVPQLDEEEINQVSANVQDGFVHIAVLPIRSRRFNTLVREFRFDCRLIKLRVNGDLNNLDSAELSRVLRIAVEYEQKWCNVVKPDSLQHPLWLPPPSFEVGNDLREYWSRCDCYGTSDRITQANNILQSVRARHRHSQAGRAPFWIDERARQFSVDRSLHGMSPKERAGRRRFRFASEVPIGFHFDVVHCQGQKFSIMSSTVQHHGCRRVNVDPWGVVLPRE